MKYTKYPQQRFRFSGSFENALYTYRYARMKISFFDRIIVSQTFFSSHFNQKETRTTNHQTKNEA